MFFSASDIVNKRTEYMTYQVQLKIIETTLKGGEVGKGL